ncbi:MAG: ABC transporter permease [Thermodesulfatator sp.]|nr:MAG: ABC transporter permease [Thermodesulfatator sp.]
MKSLRRLWVLTVKEILQLWRDRVLLLASLYLFTVDIFLAGSGIKLTLHQVPFSVFDLDRSAASRELIARFQKPYFRFQGYLRSPEEAFRGFDQGRFLALFDFPDGFEEDLKTERQTRLQLLVDTSNAIMGNLIAGYSALIVSRYAQDITLHRLGYTKEMLRRFPLVDLKWRVFFNPNQEEAWFNALSELLTVITMLTMLLPAAALVREKERGTIEQLLVSPVSPLEVLLSKISAMTLVILTGTLLAVGLVLEGCFRVPIRGSFFAFLLITVFYVFTSCGYGLFIGTLSRNLAQVGLLTIIAIAPIVFLSGTWTPPEAMPTWLRSLMVFSPLYHYLQMSFGLFLKGTGWDFLAPRAGRMLGLGVLVLFASTLFFRKRFAQQG